MSTQTSYPVFEDNQVLTSHQLNELRTFLDEENRLTRTRLNGIGVGHGFLVSVLPSSEVAISCGTGTTSEGYLATLGDCVTNRYRNYTLPTGMPYPPFMNNGIQDVILYEILTSSTPTDPMNDVLFTTELGADPAFFDDKAVILFVECADISNDSCLGRKCDEMGLDRTFTLRKLMVSLADLDKIIFRSNGALDDPLFPTKFNLDDVVMRRILFKSDQPHSQNYTDFSLNYARNFRNDIFTNIFDQLQDTYAVYKPVLDLVYKGTNPFLDNDIITLIGTWTNFLNGSSIAGGSPYLGIQYFYDFIKDLILAYNEFCETAFELASECCINMTRFPRHLMIGKVISVGQNGPSKYRQEFIYSRLQENQKIIVEKALMLHKRLVLQLRSFNFTLINNPVNIITRITPSFETRSYLTDRAIPYYYDCDNSFNLTSLPGALSDQLQRNWNYDLVRKNKVQNGVVQVRAYAHQSLNQLTDQDPIKTPLYYNLDDANFLRIEGHLRKSYLDVVTELNDNKDRFDLPFNVISLRLQGAAFDDVSARCSFEDLRSQYAGLRASFINSLDDMCERIQLEIKPATFLNQLIADADSITSNLSVEFRPPVPVSNSPAFVDVGTVEFAGDPVGFSEDSSDFNLRTVGPGVTSVFIPPVIRPGSSVSRDKPLDTLVKDYKANIEDLCEKLDNLKELIPYDFKDFKYGDDISAIEDSFIKTYIDAVNFAFSCKVAFTRIFDFIIRNCKTRFTPELYFVLSNYTNEALTLFNDFVRDSTFKQFEQLYFTYLYRVNYLVENDPQLFSNFIKKHPGIDHKAGVPMGGTFIVVYNGDNITVDIKKRDEAVLVAQNISTLTCRKAVLEAKPVKTKVEVLELNSVNFQLAQCFNLNAQFVANEVSFVAIQQIQVEEHQVIADFALPYLCCCDCDCGEIPAPQEIDLKLPVVSVPSFIDYNMGDYAFGTTITSSMDGCANSIAPLIISTNELKSKVLYRPGAGSILKLKLIQNGVARVPNAILNKENDVLDGITTPGGGVVQVVLSGGSHHFSYVPKFDYVGVDSFEYIFEIYNANGEIKLASTPGKVMIHVHSHCTVPPPLVSIDDTGDDIIDDAT
jgi:hypothetical protein